MLDVNFVQDAFSSFLYSLYEYEVFLQALQE